jgi:alkylated DNA repair dioxygenase AlkB
MDLPGNRGSLYILAGFDRKEWQHFAKSARPDESLLTER